MRQNVSQRQSCNATCRFFIRRSLRVTAKSLSLAPMLSSLCRASVPEGVDMLELLKSVAERAANYINGLDQRSVQPLPEAVAHLSILDEEMPTDGSDPSQVLTLLDEICSPATVATTGGRFFGFVTGGVLPVALAANWMAGVWDQNACLSVLSPAATRLDEIALRWLIEVLELPPDCGGALVTGATSANWAALAAARH